MVVHSSLPLLALLLPPLTAAGGGCSGEGARGGELPRHQAHHGQEGQRDPAVGVPARAAEGPKAETGADPGPAESLPGDALHHGLDGRDEGREAATSQTETCL